MTTALAPSLPFRIFQTDILIGTIHLKLPQDQMDYLKQNKEMARPQLYKAFKKRFNSNINKLQFNFNLEIASNEDDECRPKPPSVLAKHPRPDVPKEKNITWCPQQGVWCVRFKKDGKTNNVGRYVEMSRAKKIAEEYRNNLA